MTITATAPTDVGLPAALRESLRAAIAARGIGQRELGGRLGVSQPMIARILSGQRIPSGPVARLLVIELALDAEQAAALLWAADAHARLRSVCRRKAGA